MKFVAFILLASLTFVLVLAFPDLDRAAVGLSTVGQHSNDNGATNGGAAPPSGDAEVREPRHLLKKQKHKYNRPVYGVPRSPCCQGHGGRRGGYGYKKW